MRENGTKKQKEKLRPIPSEVMNREIHTLFFRESAHFVETLRDKRPLFIGIDGLFAENADGFALN